MSDNPEDFLNENGTAEHVHIGGQQEQPSEPVRRRLQPYSWDELQSLPKREYLIKGVIDRRGISVMIAPPNGAKTFHALEMAFSIAREIPFRGKRVRGGKVVYVAAEGGLGIVERIEAYAKHNGLEKIPNFYLLPKPVNFFNSPEDVQELIKEIEMLGGVEFVVIDTFAMALSGGDENGAEGAGIVLKNGITVREATGAHIMFVHHTGKNGDYRGFSGIQGDVDTMMKITENEGIFTVEFPKQRDGKKDGRFCSELKVIELGKDEDGDPITSCVLIQTDKPAEKGKPPLRGRAKDAFDILCNLMVEKGKMVIPKTGMSEVMTVPLTDFRNALKAGDIADGDKWDTQRKAIQRAIRSLKESGKIKVWRGYVWITGQVDK